AYLYKPESFYSGIYKSTTDTGESAPIWSIRFMEHVPKAHIEVIGGQAIIHERKRTSIDHEYLVNGQTSSTLRENTLYFPGWSVFIDGQKVPVQFQDPNSRGIMTFNVPRGSHKIVVAFHDTKIRIFADMLSLISLFGVMILGILKKLLWRN